MAIIFRDSEEGDNDVRPVRLPTNITTDMAMTSTSSLAVPRPRVLSRRSRSGTPSSNSSSTPKHALHTRLRLPQYSTLTHAVTLLLQSSNILVLTGAGISTSAGIPDFRSAETGIFSGPQSDCQDPEDLFHIDTFLDDPKKFYMTFQKLLPPSTVTPTPTHAFIRLLQDKGKLLRNYTQNIDQLEREAGIAARKVFNCHGTITPGYCITCEYVLSNERKFLAAIRKAENVGAPQCPACDEKFRKRWDEMEERARQRPERDRDGKRRKRVKSESRKRKRGGDDAGYGSDDLDNDETVAHAQLGTEHIGILRPSITFYGEPVPAKIDSRLDDDRDKADLLLVIGTSLKVTPVSNVCADLPANVPQIFISNEACRLRGVTPDVELLGLCDVVVAELARRAGWGKEFETLVTTQRGGFDDGKDNGAVGHSATGGKIGDTKVKVEMMYDGADNRWRVTEVKDKEITNDTTGRSNGIHVNGNDGAVHLEKHGHDDQNPVERTPKPGKIPLRPTSVGGRTNGNNGDQHKSNGRVFTNGLKVRAGPSINPCMSDDMK